MVNLILWVVFGAFIGWIASMITGTNREQGAIGNIVVGILGAFLGGLIARLIGIGDVTGFNVGSFLIALAGAVILLMIYKAIRGNSTHSPTLHR